MEEKALSINNGQLDPSKLSIKEMSFIANEMVQAKMFPDLVNAHVAFVKMLAGVGIGINPFEAVTGIHIIQGKAVMGRLDLSAGQRQHLHAADVLDNLAVDGF